MSSEIVHVHLIWVLDFHQTSISFLKVTSISMEFTNTLKEDCENGYIEFRCVVTRTWRWVEELLSISLFNKRFEKLASVSKDGVLKDTELANRSGVAINSSISDVGKYLIIRIMASEIKPKKDKGLYCCGATINIAIQGLKTLITPWRMLNITGNTEIIQYVYLICSCLQHKYKISQKNKALLTTTIFNAKYIQNVYVI